MSEPILLRLTVEELCLLQNALRIDELPGFAADLLSTLDDAQRTQALRTAAHTLRARGLVGWDEAQHSRIHPAIAEMLLDYAYPRYTLFVDTSITSTRATPFLYVVGTQAIYEQWLPEPDVIQFRILTREELGKRLCPRLRQEKPSNSTEPNSVGARFISPSDGEDWQGQIVQSVLNEGVKLAHENQEGAYRLFSNSLPQLLAEELAAAYHEPQVVQYIARWEQVPTKEHPAPDAALTILQGPEWSYLLWVDEPDKRGEALVTVHVAASNLLQAYIMQVLPPSIH